MKFNTEICKIKDEKMMPFIDDKEIWDIINSAKPDKVKVKEIIAKSLAKNRLTMEETAILLATTDKDLIEEIKQGARTLKETVYGQRIVLFAPLYIGNLCSNECEYCGFRATNTKQQRVTLDKEQIIKEVESLEKEGHKRLILVFGEHPKYDANFIAESTKLVYNVKYKNGNIRRVNINAAPLTIEGFKIVKDAGIGTYQIFQETYHKETYQKYHKFGNKSNYENRLISLDKAQEAGLDDVGIGVLFGLYDWRYEVLALIRHTNHLEAVYNVGPHTISFPRVQNASSSNVDEKYLVSDEEFVRLVAILRLAVPYTGMILTAREPEYIRKEVLRFGVSQIDGGTNIQMQGYSGKDAKNQNINLEQFTINDTRNLNEVIDELVENNYLPSFCTSCYRTGRTGEHFMEFSVPGFIKRYCEPNAILTFTEYLEDYGTEATKNKGYLLINKKIEELSKQGSQDKLKERVELIKKGERDLYF